MALSKGRARDRQQGRRRPAERPSRRGVHSRTGPAHRKRMSTLRRREPYDSISLPQLVYELLAIDKYNQDANGTSRKRFRTPRRRIQRYYKRQRFPYEMTDQCDSSESVQVSEYAMESGPTSVESLTEPTDAANSSAPMSSAHSSMSNISMEPIALAKSLNSARALFRKRSLVQLINNYIKAGIEEGKRRAKNYIRKALSFGVRSGYLIPADPQGNVLRVCSTLDNSSCNGSAKKLTDVESRRRRRNARRGKAHLTTVDDRKAMRRGTLRDKPRQNGGQVAANQSRKRREKQSDQSPASSPSTRDSTPRRSLHKSTLKERARNKPKTDTRRKGTDDAVRNKREQQRKRGDRRDTKKPVKKRRVDLSPICVENGEPIEECYQDQSDRDRDQYKRNEDYRTGAERRKSTSSRENGLRIEKATVETSIDEDNRDETERGRNIDDDEKSEEASVKRDSSDIIREINA